MTDDVKRKLAEGIGRAARLMRNPVLKEAMKAEMDDEASPLAHFVIERYGKDIPTALSVLAVVSSEILKRSKDPKHSWEVFRRAIDIYMTIPLNLYIELDEDRPQ